MATTQDKVHQFMESPLVAWVNTFDEFDKVDSVYDLVEGVVLHKIMHTVDPSKYSLAKVNRSVSQDPALRLQNLQLLITRIKDFYLTSLQQLVICTLPNISTMSHDPESDYSLDEMEKLLTLLLGCVVQCEGKVPLIERMKSMDLTQQQALVVHIQTMTDTTEYVCSIDWNDLGEISKPNLEALCRTAYLHLQRVAKERSHHYDTLVDVIIERDYYKQLYQPQNGGESLPRENGIPRGVTPAKTPAANVEFLDLKKKMRELQELLDRKMVMTTEMREELEKNRTIIQRLQQEKRELAQDAKSARTFRDEIETLKLKSAKVEKLESEVTKYRQKAEDSEYLRKRVADLKQQNELMTETKALLEQKAATLTARAESVDELQAEVAGLRVQRDSFRQEKEMDLERIEELLAQNAQLEMDSKHYQEQIAQLLEDLEAEREKLAAAELSSGGEASNLSFEMTEADLASRAKVLRLEKEAQEVEKSREALRHSQAKVVELEKTNRKLYAQTHSDRKEIIKLREEVEVLKVKSSRVDKLQVELNAQREKLEEAGRSVGKMKEWKSRNEIILEAKARLEDEVERLQEKAEQLETMRDDNASLKAQVDALLTERSEEQRTVDELLEQNAQFELEAQKCTAECSSLRAELDLARQGPQAPVTVLSPPRITEAEMASRVKLQRLEKETRELGAARESLRHAQAKMTELEKTNRKLLGQKNTNQKEIVRLREELHAVKAKSFRVERLESEIKTQEHKMEDVEAAMKKITELKQQNALLAESKVLVQDEVTSLLDKLERMSDTEGEKAALQVRVDSVEQELEEEGLRVQELLQQNAQLEMERERKNADMEALNSELSQLRVKQAASTRDVPFSPSGPPMTDVEFSSQTKLLRLEREKRELERSMQALKQTTERAAAERNIMNKKLTTQNHAHRKEIAKLKEAVRRERVQSGQLHSHITRLKSVGDMGEPDELQAKEQDLESKFKEAFSQSLTVKDERIGQLEVRIEEMTGDGTQLREEVATLKQQNEKLAQVASAAKSGGSPSLSVSRTYSPREVNRLREQAADSLRLRDKLRKVEDENQHFGSELMDSRHMLERYESACSRLNDRIQMLEQLNLTLEEEKRHLLLQVNKLLEQNRDLLQHTLASKDHAFEDERMFNDRLGELERDKVRLSERLIAQQREHLAKEMDLLKKSKSKNLLKRGFKKLKGKMQVGKEGRATFEPMDGPGGAPSLYPSSPSQASLPHSLPPFTLHDGSMSSSQSISSSNSGRHSEEDLDQIDSSLVPRAPTSDGSPFLRPRKARSYTLPAGAVRMRRPPESSSAEAGLTPDDLMSLEDFLAESEKTPNRRRVMELKRASLILNTPPVTPRNSMLLTTNASSLSVGGIFDLQEFLTSLGGDEPEGPIAEVEETESEQQFQRQTAAEFHSSQQSSSSADGPTVGLDFNYSGNVNNNNNSNDDAESFRLPFELEGAYGMERYGRSSASSGLDRFSVPMVSISSGDAPLSSRNSTRSRSRKGEKVAAGKAQSDGYSVQYLLPGTMGMGRGVPRSRSTEVLKEKESKKKGKGKKAAHISSEDLLSDASRRRETATLQPSNARKVHKSSADLQPPSPRTTRSFTVSEGASTLSDMTDLSKKGEAKFLMNPPKRSRRVSSKRHSLPPLTSWDSQPIGDKGAPLGTGPEDLVGRPDHSQDSLRSPKSDDSSEWYEYGHL